MRPSRSRRFAAVAAVGGRRVASEPRDKRPIDYAGAALITLGLAGIVGALIEGTDGGFGGATVLAMGSVGVVCLTAVSPVQ